MRAVGVAQHHPQAETRRRARVLDDAVGERVDRRADGVGDVDAVVHDAPPRAEARRERADRGPDEDLVADDVRVLGAARLRGVDERGVAGELRAPRSVALARLRTSTSDAGSSRFASDRTLGGSWSPPIAWTSGSGVAAVVWATGCSALTGCGDPSGRNGARSVWPAATTAPAATAATVARPRADAAGGAGRRCTARRRVVRFGVVFLGAAWGAVARQDLPFSMPVGRPDLGALTARPGWGSRWVDRGRPVAVGNRRESGSGNLASPRRLIKPGSGVSLRRPG